MLALLYEPGRGTTSVIDVNQRPAFLYDFRGGRIVRVGAYLDRAEVLKAVWLSRGAERKRVGEGPATEIPAVAGL